MIDYKKGLEQLARTYDDRQPQYSKWMREALSEIERLKRERDQARHARELKPTLGELREAERVIADADWAIRVSHLPCEDGVIGGCELCLWITRSPIRSIAKAARLTRRQTEGPRRSGEEDR